jgi:membrane-associated phospholipid phosphatase
MWAGIDVLFLFQGIRIDIPILGDLSVVLSSRLVYLVLPVMLMAWFYWFVDRREGEIIGVGLVSSMLFTLCLKYGIAQPRPWELDPGIEYVPGSNAHGYSCPSGHAAITSATFLPAALFCGRAVASAILVALTVSVILARLVLCAHTPLDIAVGLAVGISSALVAWKLVDLGGRSERAYYVLNAVYAVLFTVLFLVTAVFWGAGLEDIAEYAGFFYGMIIGRVLEHVYVSREVPARSFKSKVQGYVVGMSAAGVLFLIPAVILPGTGTIIGGFLLMLWLFFLFPKIACDSKLMDKMQ